MAEYYLTTERGDEIRFHREPEVGTCFEIWDAWEGAWIWYEITSLSTAAQVDIEYQEDREAF